MNEKKSSLSHAPRIEPSANPVGTSSLDFLRSFADGTKGKVLGALLKFALVSGAGAGLAACTDQPGECESVAPRVEISRGPNGGRLWQRIGDTLRVYFDTPDGVGGSSCGPFRVAVVANLGNSRCGEQVLLPGSTTLWEDEDEGVERCGCDDDRNFVDAQLPAGSVLLSFGLVVLDLDGYEVDGTEMVPVE